MEPLNNFHSWTKHMRKVRRWSATRPEVIGLRGAELVRARPADLRFSQPPKPKPAEKEEEE